MIRKFIILILLLFVKQQLTMESTETQLPKDNPSTVKCLKNLICDELSTFDFNPQRPFQLIDKDQIALLYQAFIEKRLYNELYRINPGVQQFQNKLFKSIKESLWLEKEITLADNVKQTLLSPEGSLIAMITNESVIIKNVQTQEKIAEFKNHEDRVDIAAFNHDGTLLLTKERYCQTIYVWNIHKNTLESHSTDFSSKPVWSPTENVIAKIENFSIYIWHQETEMQEKIKLPTDGNVTLMTFNNDGNLLISMDKVVYIIDVISKKVIAQLHHDNKVTSIHSTVSNKVVTLSDPFNPTIHLWQKIDDHYKKSDQPIKIFPEEIREVKAYLNNSGNKIIIIHDTNVYLFDEHLKESIFHHTSAVRSAQLSSHANWLITTAQNSVIIWDVETNEIVHKLPFESVWNAQLDPKAHRIIILYDNQNSYSALNNKKCSYVELYNAELDILLSKITIEQIVLLSALCCARINNYKIYIDDLSLYKFYTSLGKSLCDYFKNNIITNTIVALEKSSQEIMNYRNTSFQRRGFNTSTSKTTLYESARKLRGF